MQTINVFLIGVAALLAAPVSATDRAHPQHDSAPSAAAPLTAPGNDAFAAIQEVVERLLADPGTDWSRVDLEALRRHLVDMHHFTVNVQVSAQQPIDGGVAFTVTPTVPEAAGALDRLFSAHPALLKQESGWDMIAKRKPDGGYTVRVTGATPEDAAKIRGLGYIGVVAFGRHHQVHHWRMATGVDPRRGH